MAVWSLEFDKIKIIKWNIPNENNILKQVAIDVTDYHIIKWKMKSAGARREKIGFRYHVNSLTVSAVAKPPEVAGKGVLFAGKLIEETARLGPMFVSGAVRLMP